MSAVLQVSDLRISFRQDGKVVPAVKGVSFAVGAGETVALVGESGSGKSVTALSTVRLLGDAAQVEGSVTYKGRELVGAPEAELRQVRGNDISFIFQEPMTSLNPLQTLEKQLGESLALHQGLSGAAARARIVELLDKVGIRDSESRLSDYPHQFSGGQRQRICIARALALKPKLIICDESVAALDVSIQARVLDLLRDLQREMGVSYLFISHDMAVVENISDRVAVMYLGQIVEMGTRAQVFENPQHPYTKRLLSAVPVPDPRQDLAARPRLTGDIPSPVWPAGSGPVAVALRDIGGGHLCATNADPTPA